MKLERFLINHRQLVHLAPFVLMCCLGCLDSTQHEFMRALYTDPGLSELRVIGRADPMVAVKAAMRRGDRSLVSLGGYSSYPPGITEVDEDWIKKLGVRVIVGGGDFGLDSEKKVLVQQAYPYVEAYNRELIRVVKQSK